MTLSEEEISLYELAYTLRMPLYKMLEEMPYDELLGWFEYFKSRPIGWQDDYRAYLIIRSFGSKAKPEELFHSLKVINSKPKTPIESLVNSAFMAKMINSKGGDKLDFLQIGAKIEDRNETEKSG